MLIHSKHFRRCALKNKTSTDLHDFMAREKTHFFHPVQTNSLQFFPIKLITAIHSWSTAIFHLKTFFQPEYNIRNTRAISIMELYRDRLMAPIHIFFGLSLQKWLIGEMIQQRQIVYPNIHYGRSLKNHPPAAIRSLFPYRVNPRRACE